MIEPYATGDGWTLFEQNVGGKYFADDFLEVIV